MSATKQTYAIDLNVYEPANMYELPFKIPEEMVTMSGTLKLGYHTIAMQLTEEELEEVYAWCFAHGSILKIVGSEIVA